MSILIDILTNLVRDEKLKDISLISNLLTQLNKNIPVDQIPLASLAKSGKLISKTNDNYDNSISNETNSIENQVKDYRFIQILLRGIRKFPAYRKQIYDASTDSKTARVFYRIDFKQEEPISKVLLGSNGVGKSSVYAALEKICIGHLFSADLRGYVNEEQQEEYLKNISSDEKESMIILQTVQNIQQSNLSQKGSIFPYPAGFCMENDIELLCKGLDGKYLAVQLGIYDFYLLLDLMDKLKASYKQYHEGYESCRNTDKVYKLESEILQHLYTKDKDELATIYEFAEKHTTILTHSLDEFEATHDSIKKEIEEIWKKIYQDRSIDYLFNVMVPEADGTVYNPDEIQFIPSHILAYILYFLSRLVMKGFMRTSDGSILEVPGCLEHLQVEINYNHNTMREIEQVSPLLGIEESEYNKFLQTQEILLDHYQTTITEVLDKANVVFPILMKEYFRDDILNITLRLSEDNKNLSINVEACDPLTRKTMGEVEPQKYLNTFRFKVYCVALKISLAFTCSKLYNLNTPIIIDDVFDSSDFSNRERIKDFIIHIFDAHSAIFNDDQKLQLIFFTQDDVIADSVYSGIVEHEGANKVEYSRIYNYTEAEPMDESLKDFQFSNSDSKERIISISIDQKIR